MNKRIPALTGIRGIAACWVVVLHASNLLTVADVVPQVGRWSVVRSGFLAVDLFFVLSGFVLASAYAPDHGARGEWSSVGRFAVNRLLRIMPLNTVGLVFFAAVTSAFGSIHWTNERLDVRSFVAALLLVQSWGWGSPTAWNLPSWSLSAEWLAYALFPGAALALVRVPSPKAAIAGAAACLAMLAVVMLVAGGGSLDHAWRLGLVCCLTQFAAGMFLWRAIRDTPFGAGTADALLAAGLALVGIAVAWPPLQLAAPFGFALLVVACGSRSRWADRLFGNRSALFLGEISFSIYLFHFTLLALFALFGVRWDVAGLGLPVRVGFLALALVTILVVATLAWRFVERPAQQLARVASRPKSKPVPNQERTA